MRRGLLGMAAASLLVGCFASAPKSYIVSRKAPNAPTSPKRIFVVSRLMNTQHANLGMWFEKAVEHRFETALRRCGVEVSGHMVTTLDMDEDIVTPLLAFRPEAVLTISRVHVYFYDNVILHQTFELELMEAPKDANDKVRTLWKGKTTFFHRGGPVARSGAAFVEDVLNKMKDDGFFPGCAKADPIEIVPVVADVSAKLYSPMSTARASGAFTVAPFVYPAARPLAGDEEKRAALQRAFGSTEIVPAPSSVDGVSVDRLRGANDEQTGRVEFRPTLEAYTTAAVAAELAKIGLVTQDPRRTLRGTIEDASVDFSGWGLWVSLRIRYELVETATDRVLFTATKSTSTPRRGPILSEVEAFHRVLRENAEALASDPGFLEAIR